MAGIFYTTGRLDPERLNGTLYVSGFFISATTTVGYRAFDAAGNAEPPTPAHHDITGYHGYDAADLDDRLQRGRLASPDAPRSR